MEATTGLIGGDGKTRAKAATDGELAVMGMEGDIKSIWDPAVPDEVENARATFDRMRKKNYLAFKVNAAGEKGEQIREFDPEAGKIIMVPQLQGG